MLFERVNRFLEQLRGKEPVETLIASAREDLHSFSHQTWELNYLLALATVFEHTEPAATSFTALDYLHMMHFLATSVDVRSDYVHLLGIEEDRRVDLACLLEKVMQITRAVEQYMETMQEPDRRHAIMIADIHRVYLLKGWNFERLLFEAQKDPRAHELLAWMVPLVKTVAWRYEQLEAGAQVQSLQSLLVELKQHFDIPGDEEEWAFHAIARYLDAQLSAMKAYPHRLGDHLVDYDVKLSTMAPLVQPYAFRLYKESEHLLLRHGFSRLATAHSMLARDWFVEKQGRGFSRASS